MTYLNHFTKFPPKTREEKLIHNLSMLCPVLGLIGLGLTRNFSWIISGMIGHLLCKTIYLESRIFHINLDQYLRLQKLGFSQSQIGKETHPELYDDEESDIDSLDED